MVQKITAELTERINHRKIFYIQFAQIDSEHTYYPNYRFKYTEPQIDDIVAWIWGDVARFGVIYAITSPRNHKKSSVSVYILPRGSKGRKLGWKGQGQIVKMSALRCIFASI